MLFEPAAGQLSCGVAEAGADAAPGLADEGGAVPDGVVGITPRAAAAASMASVLGDTGGIPPGTAAVERPGDPMWPLAGPPMLTERADGSGTLSPLQWVFHPAAGVPSQIGLRGATSSFLFATRV